MKKIKLSFFFSTLKCSWNPKSPPKKYLAWGKEQNRHLMMMNHTFSLKTGAQAGRGGGVQGRAGHGSDFSSYCLRWDTRPSLGQSYFFYNICNCQKLNTLCTNEKCGIRESPLKQQRILMLVHLIRDSKYYAKYFICLKRINKEIQIKKASQDEPTKWDKMLKWK